MKEGHGKENLILQMVIAICCAGGFWAGEILPCCAKEIILVDQEAYDNEKDESGDIKPEDLTGNNIIIGSSSNVGKIPDAGCSSVYGGYGGIKGSTVSDNHVTIHSGTLGVSVAGGCLDYQGDVFNNVVDIDGYGEVGIDGSFHGNTVVGNVFGGFNVYEESGDIKPSKIYGNVINFSGGIIEAASSAGCGILYSRIDNNTFNIYKGSILEGVSAAAQLQVENQKISNASECNNNVVNIYGGTIDGVVYGAAYLADVDYTYHKSKGTGNAVNIWGKNLKIGGIACADELNFYLPQDMQNGDVMVALTGGVNMAGEAVYTDLSGTAIRAGLVGGSSLKAGDEVMLLDDSYHTVKTDEKTTYGQLTEGVSRKYALKLYWANNNLLAQILEQNYEASISSGLRAQTKSLVETRVADMALLNSGADLLAGEGYKQAGQAADALEYVPFAAVGGSDMRYNSGSYIDGRGWNINVGAARKINNCQGQLLFGPFAEYGRGHYDSYLNSGTHGSGQANYFGVGIMAREELADGYYYEISLHGGRMDSDYNSSEMEGAAQVDYDISMPYYAFQLGAGRVQELGHGNSMAYYGRYLYSYQEDTSAELSSGENYVFDSVSSNRLMLGTRYTHQVSAEGSMYVGAAYQYECSGSAGAAYGGDVTLRPSLRGGSGMLELGCSLQPFRHSPLNLDLGLSGWAGKQEGAAFHANIKWQF